MAEEEKKKRGKAREVPQDDTNALAAYQPQPERNDKASFVSTALAIITNFDVLTKVKDFMKRPYEKETPAEKVKKLPGSGYDYVKYSYMDKEFKDQFPLYSWEMLQKDFVMGWIQYTVRVTDRITGNSQLGAGGARIALFKNAEELNHKAIVDMGHSDAAALSNAIKNGISRFGVCADVYRRQEEDMTEEHKERFRELYAQLPLAWRNPIEKAWGELGANYGEFLDTLELRLIDYNKKQAKTQVVPDAPVTAETTKPQDGTAGKSTKVQL